MWDECRPHPRWWQRHRRLLMAVAACVALAVAVLAAPRVSRTIKRWHSTRLAAAALLLIERGEHAAATQKVRDALQLDSNNREARLAAARLVSRTAQPHHALEWWRKIGASGILTATDRRDYAAAALGAGALADAERQISELLGADAPEPADLLLSAQLAARREDGATALDRAERVLADGRSAPHQRMAAALQIYAITAPSSPPFAKAWSELVKLGSDPGNPISLDALVFLARQPGPATAATALDAPTELTLGAPETAGSGLKIGSSDSIATISRAEIADSLERHPQARPYHQLLALECRAADEPTQAAEHMREAIKRFAAADDETLVELGSWLYRSNRFQMLLDAIPLERALTQQSLFLQRLDALSAAGRVREAVELLQSQRFPLEPFSEHIYLAIARTRLAEPTAAKNEWQRAIESADTGPKLMLVGSFAEKAHEPAVAESAYAAATAREPDNRAAAAGHLRAILLQEKSRRASELAAEIAQRWPDDEMAGIEYQYLGLLIGDERIDPATVAAAAEGLVLKRPTNWPLRATLALAQLRQGRPAAALRAWDGVKATGSEAPGALAVRAATLAAAGWLDGARNDARNLAAARLLPEERALIAPLLQAAATDATQQHSASP